MNNHGTGRLALKKYESIMLLIFRLLYVEKRESLSTSEDRVVVTVEEIKNEYEVRSEKLLANARKVKEDEDVDIIKNLYGGNNDKTRKQYVKDTLKSLTDEENELKRYTAEDGRRIAFLKELIRYKRLALEVENE